MLFAQIPGADEAISAAAHTGRYEPILLAVVVVSMLAAFGWLAKMILAQSAAREERMAGESSKERERFASEKIRLENALITLTERVTEATTTAAASQMRTNDCLSEFSQTMKSVNGDIRELCELLKDRAVCPIRDEHDKGTR